MFSIMIANAIYTGIQVCLLYCTDITLVTFVRSYINIKQKVVIVNEFPFDYNHDINTASEAEMSELIKLRPYALHFFSLRNPNANWQLLENKRSAIAISM